MSVLLTKTVIKNRTLDFSGSKFCRTLCRKNIEKSGEIRTRKGKESQDTDREETNFVMVRIKHELQQRFKIFQTGTLKLANRLQEAGLGY